MVSHGAARALAEDRMIAAMTLECVISDVVSLHLFAYRQSKDGQSSLKEDSRMKTSSKPVRSITSDQVSPEEQIRCRAYELYEQRGKAPGCELEDWLQAESEVLTSTREPVAA